MTTPPKQKPAHVRYLIAMAQLTPPLSSTERLALAVALTWCNAEDGTRLRPSKPTWAKACGLTEKGLSNAIKALKERGVLEVVHESKGGRGPNAQALTNEYRVNVFNPVPRSGLPPAQPGTSCRSTPNVIPSNPERGTPELSNELTRNKEPKKTPPQLSLPPACIPARAVGDDREPKPAGGREGGDSFNSTDRAREKTSKPLPKPKPRPAPLHDVAASAELLRELGLHARNIPKLAERHSVDVIREVWETNVEPDDPDNPPGLLKFELDQLTRAKRIAAVRWLAAGIKAAFSKLGKNETNELLERACRSLWPDGCTDWAEGLVEADPGLADELGIADPPENTTSPAEEHATRVLLSKVALGLPSLISNGYPELAALANRLQGILTTNTEPSPAKPKTLAKPARRVSSPTSPPTTTPPRRVLKIA